MTDDTPHSRACGIETHPHGPKCASDCPTCQGESTPGYTVLTRVHACPMPLSGYSAGTVIRCNDCGQEWSLTLLGWLRTNKEPKP